MRPRSELRRAVNAALRQLVEQQGAVTLQQLVLTLQLPAASWPALRAALSNMLRDGEIHTVGHMKVPGETRWRALYELADPTDPAASADAALQLCMLAWRQGCRQPA